MTIDQLIEMAERIHDTEGHNLGSNSTRDTRNAFWMRVIGCAHFGHPVYNPAPDASWHVKDAGGGRPMSDDTAVHLPSREAWDCIPGAGAGSYDPNQSNRDEHGVRVPGYRFEAHALGVLPAAQHVYAPERPNGSGVPAPAPMPTPPPMATQPPGREEALNELVWLDGYYASPDGLQRPNGLSLNGKPDFEGVAAWYLDVYQRERMAMKSRAEARAAYVSQIRRTAEWQARHPGETP
jgi:hypothetical protein